MTIKLIWYLETTELKWMFSHTKQNAHQHYYFYTGILNLLFNWYFLLKLLNVIELNKYVYVRAEDASCTSVRHDKFVGVCCLRVYIQFDTRRGKSGLIFGRLSNA